jgi:hypothetical protein
MDKNITQHNLRQLANNLRSLNEVLMTWDAGNDGISWISQEIKELCKKMYDKPKRKRIVSVNVEESINNEGEYFHYDDLMDFSPVGGLANSVAPPMRIKKQNDMAVGTVNFSKSYEGAAGVVHGGYIAAVFDELLGLTQSLSGKASWTGTLLSNTGVLALSILIFDWKEGSSVSREEKF